MKNSSQFGGSQSAAKNARRMSGVTIGKRPLSSSSSSSDDCHVKVAVRCRPMSEKEIKDGHQPIVEFESDKRIVIHNVSESPSDQLGTKSGKRHNISHVYDFDTVFECNSSQKEVYDRVCRPIVESVLEGYNGTIFAYGQTGTGKTFTMEGVNRRKHNNKSRKQQHQEQNDDSNNAGIIPRTFEQIFDHIAKNAEVQFLIRASYLEIYQEEIRDLLRKDRSAKLELHERSDIGVFVKDLTSFVCKSMAEIERVMRVGNQNRTVGATDMNEHSSRSHAIFMITVEQQLRDSNKENNGGNLIATTKSGGNKEQRQHIIRVGKLNLVDLAGSERQRKTNSFGQRQTESIKINLSLSALGNVINALMKLHTQKQQSIQPAGSGAAKAMPFIPYRDSKLTRLLQDSLGGNAKTLMIANIGPASYNYDETIDTLNYASRVKCVRNRPRLNEDPKDALLRELQKEIDSLRSKLAAAGANQQKHLSKRKPNGAQREVVAHSNREIELELIELKQKLASLESKLLNGYQSNGTTLGTTIDHTLLQGYTKHQELELERRRAELANQAGREKAIRDELEKREEAELLAKESFNSIQQEVDAKRRLIRRVLFKVKSIRDEIDETQRAYRLELDELDQLQYVLQKELKLKCLIMDNFIPNNHVDQILPRIIYDERLNYCSLDPIQLPLDDCILNDNSQFTDYWQPTYDSIRPRSEFERTGEAIYPSNIRYKYEHLVDPKLDLPAQGEAPRWLGSIDDNNNNNNANNSNSDLKTTRLQALIDNALNQHETDIVI